MKKFGAIKTIMVSALFIFSGMITGRAATITSAASGSWSTGSTWVGGVVPGSSDIAVIANGHTVTVGAQVNIGSVTIQNGGIVQGNKALVISAGGTFAINAGGTYIHNYGGGSNPLPSASIFNGTENFDPARNFPVAT